MQAGIPSTFNTSLSFSLKTSLRPATLDWVGVSRKTCLLKKLASLWRSDFHAKPIFEDTVAGPFYERFPWTQSVKCGFWWMWADGNLLIRSCDGNVELSRTWRTHSLSSQYQFLRSVIVDPLQDLVVTVFTFSLGTFYVPPRQDHHIFTVEFRLASSQLPYTDSECTSLECKHVFNKPGYYLLHLLGHPAICGDRVVVLYYLNLRLTGKLFIRVIDWRTGHAKSYRLRDPVGPKSNFHLVDEQTIVLIGEQGHLALYTLHELDGSPQHRATYLLPDLQRGFQPEFVVHATPLFHGTAARPDLIPGYVPSLESQIMVLEVLSDTWPVILVIDMVIFSSQVIHSDIPNEIPWSDWGSQYTRCFPHHPSHRISVFGNKMAYILPRDCIPEHGAAVETSSDNQDHFYVHIWDFNKRAIARAENDHDRSSPDPLIRTPGQLTRSCFVGNIISNHPYTATDRLILSWLTDHSLRIQVVCPAVDTDLAME
ncbi:hypothetical protein AZE42_08374 [Rhizopogon vesiculosus]|uniref:Uncharacterized protein n=1 Tax=Rhizopogon vesiculosus TaxID=180088 RepID=A0A1J8Q6N3_9AGAM|nr:hypothetical protein AZE42_08374 [Rhizopogon vesiculosus]